MITSGHVGAGRRPSSRVYVFCQSHPPCSMSGGSLSGKKAAEFSFPGPAINLPVSLVLRKIKLRIECVLLHLVTRTLHLCSGVYSPGSVFKYSFDFIHFFFPKVNNSEMNSPILLDAHLPGKQNTHVSLCLVPAFTLLGKAKQNKTAIKLCGHGRVKGKRVWKVEIKIQGISGCSSQLPEFVFSLSQKNKI